MFGYLPLFTAVDTAAFLAPYALLFQMPSRCFNHIAVSFTVRFVFFARCSSCSVSPRMSSQNVRFYSLIKCILNNHARGLCLDLCVSILMNVLPGF